MRVGRNARIGGISFVEWPADHHGDWFVFDQDSIKSVWGGVDVRREDIARPSAHGSFDVPGFLSPRVLTLTGHMSSRSREGLEHMQARLSGLLADGGSDRLVVEGPNGSRWCDVRLGAAAEITALDATTARFQVSLWAPDPRMYGEVSSFAAGEPAINRGNFPARPVFTMNGNRPDGYTITGPDGRVITVSYPIVPGWPHVIDTATGGLFVNGNRVIGGISVWQPWTVGPGMPGVTHTITSGVSLQVEVTETYI